MSTASRYRWTILAVGLAAQMAVSALRAGLPSVGPLLQAQFGLSLGQLGVVLGAVSVGIVLTLIPWGALTDRVGERRVIAIGLPATALALVAASRADDYPALVASLVAAGMFGASATGASGRAVTGWFARSERGLALGIRQTGVPLGGGIAAIALPLIAGAADLQAALLALAGGCIVAALAGLLWMREPPPARRRRAGPTPPPLRDSRLWRLAAGGGLLVIAQASVLAFVVVFLHAERGWSTPAAAAVLAVLQVGGSVVRIVAGRWSDRREDRVAPMRAMAGGSAVLLLAAAALVHGPGWLLAPALLGAGVLAMGWNGLAFTAAAEISGRERAGTAISVQNAVLSAGAAIAPMAFGLFVESTSWEVGWAALTVFQLAGIAVLGASVAEERRRRAARHARARSPHEPGSWHPVASARGRPAEEKAQ
jgi:sugar phosphate permease